MDGIEGQPILQISLIHKFPTVVQRQTTFPPFMQEVWNPVLDTCRFGSYMLMGKKRCLSFLWVTDRLQQCTGSRFCNTPHHPVNHLHPTCENMRSSTTRTLRNIKFNLIQSSNVVRINLWSSVIDFWQYLLPTAALNVMSSLSFRSVNPCSR